MGWDVGCSKRVGAEIRMHERLGPEGIVGLLYWSGTCRIRLKHGREGS